MSVEMFVILEALYCLGGVSTSREISAELESNPYFADNYQDHIWNLKPRQVGARIGWHMHGSALPLLEWHGGWIRLTSYGWGVAEA